MGDERKTKNFWTKKKKIAFVCIAIILLISGLTTYFVLNNNKNNNFIIGETLNVTEPLEYLSMGENNEYYLTKANSDIKFKVTTDDEELKYKIIDEDENEIETIATKHDNYYEIVNSNNYQAGMTYTLTLENAKFTDEKLKDITKLNFTIIRPNANTQVLNSDVKKVNNKTITNIEENADNYILTAKKEYQKNDILYVENENTIQVFKVDTISKDNDNYIITTTTPQLEEIYKELDIYGEFTPNITDFIPNKELEEYVKVAVIESNILDNLLDSLGTTVYASSEELIQVEIKPQKDGSVKAVITINLVGNDSSFINLKDMKNHEITFEMEMNLKLKSFNEINFSKTDVGANIDIEITKTLSLKPKEEYWADFKEQEENNDIQSLENAKEILSSLKEDIAKEEQNLGTIYIPSPIAGITVNFSLNLIEKFKIAFELNSSETATIHTTFGYKNGIKKVNQVGFYWNSSTNVTKNDFNAVGKAEIKLGIYARIQINFIEVIKVGASTGAGAYAEGSINYIETKENENTIDGKFEYGFYVDGKVYGKIFNTTIAEKTIYDKKWKLAEYNRDIMEEKRIEAEKKAEEERIEAERKAEEERKAKEEAEKKEFEELLVNYAGTYVSKYSNSNIYTLNSDGSLIFPTGKIDKPISINKEPDGSIMFTTAILEIETGAKVNKGYLLYPIGVGIGDNSKLRLNIIDGLAVDDECVKK